VQASPQPHLDFAHLASVPHFKTRSPPGYGIAVCRSLGLMVTTHSDSNCLTQFSIPHHVTHDSGVEESVHPCSPSGRPGFGRPLISTPSDYTAHTGLMGHPGFTGDDGTCVVQVSITRAVNRRLCSELERAERASSSLVAGTGG
jgi:hypothetical protein